MQYANPSARPNRRFGVKALRCGLLVGWTGALLLAVPAAADQHLYQLALDTDEASATGCALDFPGQGSLSGFEWLVALRVDSNYAPPRVHSVELVPCVSGDWDFAASSEVSGGGWNAGLGSGSGGGDFAEGFVPLSSLGSPNAVRLAVRSTSVSGDADAVDSQVASPMRLDFVAAVPGLEPLALGLLAATLLGTAILLRRYPALRVLVVILGLGVAVRAVQALPFPGSLSGSAADWTGVAALASDPAADVVDPAADLLAFYAVAVGPNLVFRFDLSDLEGACTTPGDLACDGVCGALDTDPGDCDGVCDATDAATASLDCDGPCSNGSEVCPPPATPAFSCPASGTRSSANQPTLTGTGPEGMTVEIYEGATLIATGAIGASWSVQPTTPQADGVHTYRARAVSSLGQASELSDPITVVVDTTSPGTPEWLVVIPGEDFNHLSWAAVDASDLLGYEVWRKGASAPDSTWAQVPTKPVTGTQWSDKAGDPVTDPVVGPPTPGVSYCYKVRAVDDTQGDVCAP